MATIKLTNNNEEIAIDNKALITSELLWTNPNPSVAFISQNIDISITKTPKFFVIYFRNYSSSANYFDSVVLPVQDTTSGVLCMSTRYSNSVNYLIGRYVTYNPITKRINIQAGYGFKTYGTAATENDALIPYKIYAIY